MSRRSMTAPFMIWALVFAAGAMSLIVGCGDGEFPIRAVKGKVVCNGQPVTSGTVTFTPIGETNAEFGKPAIATVGPDGTFVLTTNEPFDGAVVGQHSVQYVAAEEEEGVEKEGEPIAEGSAADAAQNAKMLRERWVKERTQCVQTNEITVEVKDGGDNDFTITLYPPPN